MSDLEVIYMFVNPGESFSNSPPVKKTKIVDKDVYFIHYLNKPTGGNIDYLYRVFSHTKKRLVASGVVDEQDWVPYFNKLDCVYMDVDDNTIVFAKDV